MANGGAGAADEGQNRTTASRGVFQVVVARQSGSGGGGSGARAHSGGGGSAAFAGN